MRNLSIGCAVGAIIGFAAGIIMAVAAMAGFAFWWTSPIPDVTAEIPDSVVLDQRFEISILVSNPHDEALVLSNVDIPDEFFTSFNVVGVWPMPADSDPLRGLGSQTWFFELEIPLGDEQVITFEVLPFMTGDHVIEFDVCNATEDCTRIVRAIAVE